MKRTLENFVGAAQRAQAAVDAIAITAQLAAVRVCLENAKAWNADEAIAPSLDAALLELGSLSTVLANHFERSAPGGSA